MRHRKTTPFGATSIDVAEYQGLLANRIDRVRKERRVVRQHLENMGRKRGEVFNPITLGRSSVIESLAKQLEDSIQNRDWKGSYIVMSWAAKNTGLIDRNKLETILYESVDRLAQNGETYEALRMLEYYNSELGPCSMPEFRKLRRRMLDSSKAIDGYVKRPEKRRYRALPQQAKAIVRLLDDEKPSLDAIESETGVDRTQIMQLMDRIVNQMEIMEKNRRAPIRELMTKSVIGTDYVRIILAKLVK